MFDFVLGLIIGVNAVGLLIISYLMNMDVPKSVLLIPALNHFLNEMDCPRALAIIAEVLFVIIFLPAILFYAISLTLFALFAYINVIIVRSK